MKYLLTQLWFYSAFRLSESKTKHNSMNATWPKSPLFFVFDFLLLHWSREALFLREFLDKYSILVPIVKNKECLGFKLGFCFFVRWDPLACSRWGTVTLVSWLKIKDFRQKLCVSRCRNAIVFQRAMCELKYFAFSRHSNHWWMTSCNFPSQQC